MRRPITPTLALTSAIPYERRGGEGAEMAETPGSWREATVPAGAGGDRLDRFLARALPEFSRMRLKALIDSGAVSRAGEVITEPSRRVKPGETFRVDVPAPAPARPAAQDIPLDIRHEDDDLVVLVKPPGLVVHPAPGNPDRTLVNALLAHCAGRLSGIGGELRPGIVHRLDKDTGGLMVVAKTDRAHRALTEQFRRHDIERAYRALVAGVPEPPAGVIEGAIGRHPTDRKRMAVRGTGGKPARTRYLVLRRFGRTASLVECRLETGRTHQIRVHMAHIGHPVLGDPVYRRRRGLPGALTPLPPSVAARVAAFGRQALHAVSLGFDHPATGRRLAFDTPLPDDMQALAAALEALEESS
jgi:23S rRNA pseudouridine1911/1915/1917 synthase